jgi:cytochrome c oxidase subunit 2
MMAPARRRALIAALGAGSTGVAGVLQRVSAAAAPPREIAMQARRFEFTPTVVQVAAGESVVLVVRSLDFIHGLSIPDLGVRADLVPGRVTRIELKSLRAGSFDFVCDNFCGDGHERMHGRIVVAG